MDLFPDRAHVRLRSRVRGAYLHADEDGVGVTLSARRASLGTAWTVHRVPREDGVAYVLLHGAAYGRYLARSAHPAPLRGHRGSQAIQRTYSAQAQQDVLWVAVRAGDHVLLRHVSGRLLRANGRYRWWHNGVSVDDVGNHSTMIHWEVEPIPPRAAPPELPLPPPHPEESRRIIVYVQAESHGYCD
ncbi:hypothetical protein BAE44_0011691, partial [Dichanthelium oligosanthes]